MYVICTYDITEKRCPKVMKVLRRYMFHVQKSVFEGELTPAKFNELKIKLNKIVESDDSVLFYFVYENKLVLEGGNRIIGLIYLFIRTIGFPE